MKERLILLYKILQEMGLSPDPSSFQNRIMMQKAVYLAQAVLGRDFGYRYSWYLHGPYCTDLTKDYFALDELNERDLEGRNLKESVRESLKKISNAAKRLAGSENRNLGDAFEALASMYYLYKIDRPLKNKLIQSFRSKKPHLMDLAETAYEYLKELNLVKS